MDQVPEMENLEQFYLKKVPEPKRPAGTALLNALGKPTYEV